MLLTTYIIIIITGCSLFFIGRNKIVSISKAEDKRPHSLYIYYGFFPAILGIAPSLVLLSLWIGFDDVIFNQMLKNRFPNNGILKALKNVVPII